MQQPKITVITATYNCASTLERTLKSVLEQNYSNLEYIIIDGVSTDGTLDIVEKYKSQLSCVVSEPDKGIYDAMNKGLDRASGDFIYFIGGDDVMKSGVLNEIAPKLSDKNTLYYGNVIMQPIELRYLGKFNKYKFLRKNISHQAIFFPRSVFESGRRYSMDYRLLSDYVFNLDLWSEGVKFQYIDVDIADFQLAGASGAGDKKFLADWPTLIRNRFSFMDYCYFMIAVRMVDNIKNTIRPLIKR